MRISRCEAVGIQAHQPHHLSRASRYLLLRLSLDFQNHARIPLDGEMRKQAGLLDDIPHAAPQPDYIRRTSRLALDRYFSAGRLDHPIHRAQQRRLS